MEARERLQILGFANDQVIFQNKDGVQVAIRESKLESSQLETISMLLNSGIKDWTDTKLAPVVVDAFVEKDSSGNYLTLALGAIGVDNN